MSAIAAGGAHARHVPRPPILAVIIAALLAVGCAPAVGVAPSSRAPSATTGTVTLYTSVQQPVVDAVLAAYAAARPGVMVELFRAPTGELSARIAAELRDGRIHGDVLWLTDPLSMQAWADQGILRAWTPANAAAIDPADKSASFWGTRLLNMVIVRGTEVRPTPADWDDLADPSLAAAVALPDPGFAGSAFGTLGFFALEPDYGMAFYERLRANGAVQVRSPDEVTTGVAEGRFKAGITLDSSARAAVDKGSPVELVWPASGAITMYGPVGVVDGTANAVAAEALVEFLLSPVGQRALGDAGQEPVLPGSGGPAPEGPQVRPDWPAVFGQQDDLLERYRAVFGG